MAEHTPQPGVTWEQQLRQAEQVIHERDGDSSPFGWFEAAEAPSNRASRRALKRASRKGNR